LGTITVEGSYDQIASHIKSWSRIPNYIASVRGLSIQGTGSRLQGTYGLTLLVYVNTEFVSGGPGDGGTVPDLSASDNQQGDTGTGPRPDGRSGPSPATGGGGMSRAGGGGGQSSLAPPPPRD
jgi:hypothetical protein